MATKAQWQRKVLREIWADGVGSTGTRDADAITMRLDSYAWKLSKAVAASRWVQMRVDCVV